MSTEIMNEFKKIYDKYNKYELYWDYDKLSLNPNVDWNFVKKHIDKPWNFKLLSCNINITYDIIKKLKYLNWNLIYFISYNPNINLNVINELKNIDLKILYKNYENDQINEDDYEDDIDEYKQTDGYRSVIYTENISKLGSYLSYNPYLTDDMILNNQDIEWLYDGLSSNENINWSFIKEKLDKKTKYNKWNINKLISNPNVDLNYLIKNKNIDIQNYQNINFDICNSIVKNIDFDFEKMKKTLTEDNKWMKVIVMGDIGIHGLGRLVTKNPNITWDIVNENKNINWCYEAFGENPNLTLDILDNNLLNYIKNIKLLFKCISNNHFLYDSYYTKNQTIINSKIKQFLFGCHSNSGSYLNNIAFDIIEKIIKEIKRRQTISELKTPLTYEQLYNEYRIPVRIIKK
jgi:hypothetical protein